MKVAKKEKSAFIFFAEMARSQGTLFNRLVKYKRKQHKIARYKFAWLHIHCFHQKNFKYQVYVIWANFLGFRTWEQKKL